MAQFIEDLQNLKESFPHDMEVLNSFSGFESLNPNQDIAFPNQGFSQLPMNFHNDVPRPGDPIDNAPVLNTDQVGHFFSAAAGGPIHVASNTRRACNQSESDCFVNSSASVYATDQLLAPKKKTGTENYSGKKRKRKSDREVEKPTEVVHVRAKRGQATDSHSLAERLRREKINEKLRCLQDLVPGCYKTMGMAVMLDVIINYVRSLQNQIDFLSMKLSAASLFYDFNTSDVDAMQGTNAFGANGMERMIGEGYGGFPQFHNTSWHH